MASPALYKFPKDLIPALKEEYLKGGWLFLIKQWNEYYIGEHLCPVCPASVDRVKEGLRGIFLADAEVLFKEGKRAEKPELAELFVKHVNPNADLEVVQKIDVRFLVPTIAAFANADLIARRIGEPRRRKILLTVFRISYATFSAKYCDGC